MFNYIATRGAERRLILIDNEREKSGEAAIEAYVATDAAWSTGQPINAHWPYAEPTSEPDAAVEATPAPMLAPPVVFTADTDEG